MHKFIFATAAVAMTAFIAAPATFAQTHTGGGIGSVVNCDSPGNRQANGAIIGLVAGAVVGNNVSKSDGAPLVGALAGAATGSYVGCAQQRNIAASRNQGQFVATTNVNVRNGPSTRAGRITALNSGQMVYVDGYSGNWARVRLGAGSTGYVNASYLRPVR